MKDIFERFEFGGRVGVIYEGVKARLKSHDEREGTYTGFPDDGKTPFEDMFEKYAGEPYIVREAYGIVESWLVSEIPFFEGDILVGFPRPCRPVYEHFCRGITIEGGDERTERLSSEMVPFSYDEMHRRSFERVGKSPEEYDAMCSSLWWTGGYQGHTVPSYPKLLSMGLDGVMAQIDEYDAKTDASYTKKKDFYRACRIIIDGMSRWIELHADKAASLAAQAEGEKKEQLLTIGRTCRKVAHEKPETFLEAAQLMWFYCLWDWVDCVGRFDQYMYPFWRGDEDLDTLTAIFLKTWEHGVHNMTVGGVIPETGEDATNDITYHTLRIMRTMHETHPRMTVRVHGGTPHELWQLVVLMWSEGMSDPTIASDKNAVEGLTGYGVPLRDARDYSILGCQEIEIPGKSNFGCEDGSINLAKILEYTLFNGRDMITGVKCGLDLGCLTDYKTFDDLWSAYVKEVEYITEMFCDCCNIGVDRRVANVSKLVKSTMTEACVERGLQHDEGGTVYNFGVVETAGHGAVADSLYALKTLVYEQGKLTLEEVYEALLSDFEGHEDIRRMLLSAPKFGNNDEGADEMAARVLGHFWSEIRKYKSRRGDVFTGACSLLGGGIEYGKGTWAMADGRHKGAPLGNTIGPRTGSDKNGLTAMLSSVAKMPLHLGVGGTTCNVLIPTTITATDEDRENIISLMKTFSETGGQLAQITTAPLEDMKDAQIHPEDHGDLIVRLGGFSMKFIDFDTETQNEFIMRYACAAE
ncbi:MAG: hypothetical protein IKG80_05810 [Clostridia bacterium]|nr:hypothetical protein [Clostridia bacterium]